MLNSFEKNLIELIKSSLEGKAPCVDSGLDLGSVYEFSQKMQITPLIYYAVEKIPNAFESVWGKKFLKSSINYSYICQNQIVAENIITNRFREENIDYLILKGARLRYYYPSIEMRLMSDADILIKPKQYKKIKKIMRSLGYLELTESDHEYIWRNNNTNVELHKRLIPSYNKDYYAYFGDGWRLAKKESEDTSAYVMTNEDNLIYLFVHYAKHYRDAGVGIKHVIDLYVYLNKHKDLDFNYIENELKKLQLADFWHNTKRLIDVWFDDKECDEISAFMTHKIFSGSVYGTNEAHILSEGVKTSKTTSNVKSKSIIRSVFPSYKYMKQKHKYLKILPFMLPIAWLCRWIAVLFSPKRIKRKKQTLDKLSKENIQRHQAELNFVGLDFNFN